MKRILHAAALALVVSFLSGCMSTTCPDQDDCRLCVRILVDGADRMMIRGDRIWVEHLAYELPGRWGGGNYPITINRDHQWHPVWDGNWSDKFEIPDKDSALPPNQAFDETTLTLSARRAAGTARITQYPNAENDFTLVVMIDDRGPIGPHWYNLCFDWE